MPNMNLLIATEHSQPYQSQHSVATTERAINANSSHPERSASPAPTPAPTSLIGTSLNRTRPDSVKCEEAASLVHQEAAWQRTKYLEHELCRDPAGDADGETLGHHGIVNNIQEAASLVHKVAAIEPDCGCQPTTREQCLKHERLRRESAELPVYKECEPKSTTARNWNITEDAITSERAPNSSAPKARHRPYRARDRSHRSPAIRSELATGRTTGLSQNGLSQNG
jgi:hypothetical protein